MVKNMDQQEESSRLTSEALDDVDTGEVIDHQLMQAWADSLEVNIGSRFDQLLIAEIKVAIEEADKGQFASEESVRNFFKKWGVDAS